MPLEGGLLCSWCALRVYPHGRSRVSVPTAVGASTPVRSAVLHDGVPREIITRLKFGGEKHLARTAAWLISTRLGDWRDDVDLLVPMPISARRRRERGFNQSLEIARWLSRDWKVPVARLLGRKHRPPQTGLGRKDRLRNVAGCYYPRKRPGGEGSTVCLVDDVVTTGSSIEAASEALGEVDMERVRAVTVTYRGFSGVSMI
ncbi:hypothetical protein GF402_07785 [Candidatus Fermentibacteria bacterium]|nr:hypothetical protein [Candidatus Fermentibacteria bacterium]